ncbi:hypothetical protein ACJZ2D_000338 [Fusarium nematophilum]
MAFTSPTSLWVYNSLALGLYILRLSVRKWKRQDFTNGDYWTVSATVWIIIRLGISHTTLKYGNNLALSDQQREEMPFTDREIHYLVLNSKLNLFFRVVLLSLLWSLKMVVLDLITFLFRRHHYEHVIRWGFYTVFLITYLVPFVLIFVECRPFHLYWQLQPNPGKCVRGTWWLFSYEAGNIATDAMLIVPPFTIIFQAKITLAKYASPLLPFLPTLLCQRDMDQYVANNGLSLNVQTPPTVGTLQLGHLPCCRFRRADCARYREHPTPAQSDIVGVPRDTRGQHRCNSTGSVQHDPPAQVLRVLQL